MRILKPASILYLVTRAGEVSNLPAIHWAPCSGFYPLEGNMVDDGKDGKGGRVNIRLCQSQSRYEHIYLLTIWRPVYHTIYPDLTIICYSVTIIYRFGSRGVFQLV